MHIKLKHKSSNFKWASAKEVAEASADAEKLETNPVLDCERKGCRRRNQDRFSNTRLSAFPVILAIGKVTISVWLMSMFGISSLSAEMLALEPADGGALRLSASDGSGVYLLRESSDLYGGEPADLVMLPDQAFRADRIIETEARPRMFFWLNKAGESGLEADLVVNPVAASKHLATLKYGKDVEVKYFGWKTASGWPTRVTQSTVRIGKKRYKVRVEDEEEGIELLGPDLEFENPPDQSFLEQRVGRGFVVVSRQSENTVVPDVDPVIQLIGNDRYVGTVYREFTTEYVGDYGLDSVYEYEVVLNSVFHEHEVDKMMKAAQTSACAGWGLAQAAAGGIVAGPAGYAIAGRAALDFTLCVAQVDKNPPRLSTEAGLPVMTDYPREFIEGNARIRGSLPVAGNHEIHSSQWEELFDDFGALRFRSSDDFPVLFINIGDPGDQRIRLTKSWGINNGFVDSERVRTLTFDFRQQLEGISPEQIERVEWRVGQRVSGVDYTLSTQHQSGANGSFTGRRRINGFTSLTPGFVIPRKPDNAWLGIWLFDMDRSFQFPQSESPKVLRFAGDRRYESATETDPSRFGAYFQPFSVEVITDQSAEARSHVFGVSPPSLEQTNASFGGDVSVTIVLKN